MKKYYYNVYSQKLNNDNSKIINNNGNIKILLYIYSSFSFLILFFVRFNVTFSTVGRDLII
jgi:hypothetical protein